jgi:hypothetical protein
MLIDKSPTLSISLLICIAEMINRKLKQQVVAKQNTLADIIDFNIEFINLIFCFLLLPCFPKQALKALP